MIAVQEQSIAMIVVAVIGALASIISAALVQRTHREVRSANGTRTGALVDRIADKVLEIDSKVDRMDVRLAETVMALEQHAEDRAAHGGRRRKT